MMINCNDPKTRRDLHAALDHLLSNFDEAEIFMTGVTPVPGGYRYRQFSTGRGHDGFTNAAAAVIWKGLQDNHRITLDMAMDMVRASIIRARLNDHPTPSRGTCSKPEPPDN